jgi:crossover junction endodeoxyribonuclease RuvC
MRILGIDPGLANTGWGVIETIQHKSRPVSFGVITTNKEVDQSLRIISIAEQIAKISKQYEIEYCSIEDIYFTKNISSAISVAKVIGAITHALGEREIPLTLYSPLQIKSTITGYGKADKKQVQDMIKFHLGLVKIPRPDHAADALAAAVCFATYFNSLKRMK